MATATKGGALSYYAASPEEQEAVKKYRDAQAALQEALVSRQQLFDPTLLAIAQGFLAPTKTGSFGESLANVAGQVGPVQSAEEKRDREIAQIRMELAAQELGMTQQTRRQRSAEEQMRRLTGGAPEGGPAAGAPPEPPAAGAPGAPGAAMPGAAAGRPAGVPAGLRPIMESDILAMSEVDPERAGMLEKLMKSQRDRLLVTQGGAVFDRVKGDFTGQRVPSQEQKEYRTPFGRVFMLPWQHDMFVEAAQRGEGKQWMDNFMSTGVAARAGAVKPSEARPAEVAEAPGAPKAPGARMKTVEEERADEAAQKLLAEKRAEGMAKRTEEAINAGQNFTSRMATYNSLDKIAARPDADKIFGILNRPGVGEAIAKLVGDTLRLGPGTTISAPALESALRNVNLPQELINQYQFALSQMANLQLQQSKITEGQGAVSDRERELFATAAITDRDNPATIRAKLEMYRIKARFDRELANELVKSGLTLDQFKMQKADWLDPREQRYLDQVEAVVERLGLPIPKPGAKGAASGSSAAEADRRLRERLGL